MGFVALDRLGQHGYFVANIENGFQFHLIGGLMPTPAVASLLLLGLATPPSPAAECPVPIAVRDATGHPLPGAEVVIEPGGRVIATDGGGVACADSLADGAYEVAARRAGFAEDRATLVLPATAGIVLTLRPAIEESVVVTGARAERELRTVPYSISVIRREEIDASGADSAGELLRDVPGVQITDTSLAGNKRVRIRGEVGSNVLVLVDGREISEQRSFHGAAPLLLDVADLDRVELVRGPSSVVYGSKAIGGTVNFISRPPAAEKAAGRATLTLNSATRGYDGGASLSGTLDWFDYRLSASHSDHGDRRVPDEVRDNAAYSNAVGRLESSGFDSDYLTAEVGRRWGGSRLAVRFEDFRSAIESHTSNEVLESGLDSFQLDLPRQDRRTFAATYRAAGLSRSLPSVAVTAYLQRRNRDFDQTLGIREPGFAGPGSLLEVDLAIETVYEQDTAGLLTSLEWTPARSHRVVAGVDLVRDEMDAAVSDTTTTTLTFPRAPRPIVDVAVESPVNETRQDSAGLFLQDEWALARRLKLVLGARYNVFESSLLSTTNENLETGSSRNGKLSGAASLLFEPSSESSLRASYSQGYRNPSLLELYEGTAHGGGGLLYPNPDLVPETSDNLEIGARLATARLSIDTSAFYTRARDYVTTRLCGGGAPCPPGATPGTDRVYENANGARTRGLELSAAWRFDPLPLELFGEATYLHREFEYADFTTSATGLPRLWGRGGVRLGRTSARDRRYFAELSVRAASGAEEELGPGDVVTYPGWAVVAARGGVEIGSRVPLGFSLEVGNILDEAYRPAQESLYQPGRYVLARIVTRF
jgi:hemoglobin/transferrin/lactoferrin receptor protein